VAHQLTFVRKTGAEFISIFDDLAALRIAVFRDFPYLYEGTLDYEKEYLQVYADAERSFLFAVYDRSKMVGATTCIPLTDETAEVQAPFLQAGIPLDRVFYFGESILLPSYRGLGLGHRFFDEREAHAHHFGTYSTTCFCAVERPIDHPLRPLDYQPLDVFWIKRGYTKRTDLQSNFEWLDIGTEQPSTKKMIYWVKPQSPNGATHPA
jgi:GNAT superfamily N-acetyltransferase